MEYKTGLPPSDKLFSLFLSTGWNREYRLTETRYRDAVASSFHSVSAWDGDTLTGFGRIVSDGVIYGMIYEMMVLPEYQGRGIGSDILTRLISYARKSELRELQLFCADGKSAFYTKHGFQEREPNAPGMILSFLGSATHGQ